MAGNVDIGAVLGEQLLNAAKIMEEQVDEEIKQLEKMDEDDLEVLKRKRMGKCLNLLSQLKNARPFTYNLHKWVPK